MRKAGALAGLQQQRVIASAGTHSDFRHPTEPALPLRQQQRFATDNTA